MSLKIDEKIYLMYSCFSVTLVIIKAGNDATVKGYSNEYIYK